jgi:recombination protein RecT
MNPSNQIAQKPRFSVAISTPGYQKLINNTLGDPDRAKRFIATITSGVAVNPTLQDCDAGTILAAALLGESLNLSPSPQLGQFYLVPFKSKEKKKQINGKWVVVEPETIKAQFVLGYKGYLQLAFRSGQYGDIDVIEVHEGEYKGRDSATGKPKFSFVEDDDVLEGLPVVGYMAYYEYLNGAKKVLYWSKKKMMSHADKYSPAFSADAYQQLHEGKIPNNELWKYSSFWYKEFDEMAKKTMLRQLISKWGVMSTEMLSAIERDSSIVEMDYKNDFVITPEEQIEALTPEASDVVENVNLDELE